MSIHELPAEAVLPQETREDWSLHLQRRVMRLLLLHDTRLFRGQFRTFFARSTLPTIPLLQQYDRYIKLLTLSDELLEDILPRIRRQLSLQANQVHLQEEAPTHGDIDWQRTMRRNLKEMPGLTPLRFDTRLRERSMTNPENMLAVAVLLQYRCELKHALLEGLDDEAVTEQERQALAGADERAERELAAPYARTLLHAAQQADIDALLEQVTRRLRPGASPYRDLIAWWHNFSSLRIGRAVDEQHMSLASKRDDEKADAWLYELWIALEFAHLLHEARAISAGDVSVETDILRFTFSWNGRRFRFIYNRQPDLASGTSHGWQHGPASRPDFTIEREHPLEVRYKQALIWREPPVILDAKYYLEGSDPTLTHGPIKKLLGDMQLLGALQGALFFPRLADPSPGQLMTREIQRRQEFYNTLSLAEVRIRLYKPTPTLPLEILQARLRDVLNYASDHLPDRVAPACQGMWLDPDSINASHTSVPQYAVLCPKPHISAEVFDVVDAEKHCLKDPRLCHVIGQPIVPPIVIRATTRDQLTHQASDIRERNDEKLSQAEKSGDEDRAELLRNQVFFGIGKAVEQYVKLKGNTAMIEENFERWIFGKYWKQHERSLAEETRRMLVSGEYVWYEYSPVQLEDWAAPAIQYCRALEREMKRRMYEPCPDAYNFKDQQWSLGKPAHFYTWRIDGKNEDKRHWGLIVSLVTLSGSDLQAFEVMMQRLCDEGIADLRNELAHGKPIAKQKAQALREAILGNRGQPGILLTLAEQLRPA